MVAQANDSFTAMLAELVPDASETTSPDAQPTMPMAPSTAEPGSANALNGAASPDDAPLIDMTQLPAEQRAFLDQWYEDNKFKADKAALQSQYQSQVNQERARAAQAEATLAQQQEFNREFTTWNQSYWREVSEGKRQPDYDKDLAVWMVGRQAAQQQAAQSNAQWENNFKAHAYKDLQGHNAEVAQRAAVTVNGQTIPLFDKNDPTLLKHFQTYMEHTREHYRQGPNSPHGLAASRAFGDYQRQMDRLEAEGKLRVLAQYQSRPATQAQSVAAAQAARGPISLGQGGSTSPTTFADYIELAKQQEPHGNYTDHLAIAMGLQRAAEQRR